MVAAWLAAGLVIALGAFTTYRLVRSWRTARAQSRPFDPPGFGPA
jgi:hypothetical protein